MIYKSLCLFAVDYFSTALWFTNKKR